MPSTAQIASHLAAPLLRPLRALATLPDWLPKMHASASLRLTLVAADHLLASDAALARDRDAARVWCIWIRAHLMAVRSARSERRRRARGCS